MLSDTPVGTRDNREHIQMWMNTLRAVFRSAWGTDAHVNNAEARREAMKAILNMGVQAEMLQDELRVVGKPITSVESALKAIAKDLSQ